MKHEITFEFTDKKSLDAWKKILKQTIVLGDQDLYFKSEKVNDEHYMLTKLDVQEKGWPKRKGKNR